MDWLHLVPLRYRLRTLLILLAVLPMLIGGAVNFCWRVHAAREKARQTLCTNVLTLGVARYVPETSK